MKGAPRSASLSTFSNAATISTSCANAPLGVVLGDRLRDGAARHRFHSPNHPNSSATVNTR